LKDIKKILMQVFEALGATDELSSHLGLVIALAERCKHPYSSQLQRVQCLLQDIGSCIATPLPSASAAQLGNGEVHTCPA
jgi:cob(I)alamin adenosyltransferase